MAMTILISHNNAVTPLEQLTIPGGRLTSERTITSQVCLSRTEETVVVSKKMCL